MCIIVAKGRGLSMPEETTLKQCFRRNPDGAGYMYINGGEVVGRKGLMTFDSFYESLSSHEFGIDARQVCTIGKRRSWVNLP